MNELEIGMYVRTKKGISKIDEERRIEYGLFNPVIDILKKEIIIKASYNIIDLIEVGDYVNGKLVSYIKDIYTTDNIYIGKYLYEEDRSLIGGEEDIKSIVTKEQFESMSYKVGD